jgi:DNA-directed RNA polymerase specialized sigma24 family protein
VASAEEFVEFAEVMFPRLRRTAFLLCGDWHTAEDLAQTALAKMFVAWREIRRQDGVHAYANRTLVNSYLAHPRPLRVRSRLSWHALCGMGGWLAPGLASEPEASQAAWLRPQGHDR